MTTRTVDGVRDAIEAWLGRFSFRTKLAVVWAFIFVALAVLFVAFQFDTQFMVDWLPYILGGVPLTILISVGGILLAVPLALVAALARISSNPVLYGVSGFYISFIRGTPLIVQIFFIYLGLPQLASYAPEALAPLFILGSVTSGILALGLNYGAYMAEIFRAGIQSVGYGQAEAAQALGMTRWQTTRRIVLPQAVRTIIPPTGNEFIAMTKDSALVGIVGTQELFFRASKIGRQYFHSLETLVVAAIIYWILTSILTYFQAKLERRLERGYVRNQTHGH